LLGLVISRGLAALALTLVLALPALAKEQDAGNGPPPHAQGPPADAGPAAPPADAGPPPAESQPAVDDAGPPEQAAGTNPPGPPAESDAYPGKSKAKKPHPHAKAASRPADSAPAGPTESTPPRGTGRVDKRSVGEPDLSEPAPEATGPVDAGKPRDRRAPAPRRAGALLAPEPAADPVPAAVTFRRAVGRTRPGGEPRPADVAAAASSATPEPVAAAADEARSEPVSPAQPLPVRVVPRQVREIVEVVPGELWAALGALALLALALGASSWITAIRARRLRRQREALLQEVGLLQAALLPSVPEHVPVSAAYRPAEGVAAGGDFYEAFALADGRTAIILGGVADRGRDALARTTFVRYTLRAYLEAGLEPREVVKVGSQALADHLAAGFATLTIAIHEPDTGRFTYACAGQAPPVVVGSGAPFEPVTACSAPPVGVGEPTGFRQTSFTLTAGSRACLYTQGVIEARLDGRLLGTARLEETLESLPSGAGAEELLDAVVDVADETTGDMAVCVIDAPPGAPADGPRVEELDVDEREVGDSLEHFLRACGVPLAEVPGILREAGEAARREGSATVRVRLNDFRPGVDVVPGNLVRLEERRRAVRL
jgi:hypothetical protein